MHYLINLRKFYIRVFLGRPRRSSGWHVSFLRNVLSVMFTMSRCNVLVAHYMPQAGSNTMKWSFLDFLERHSEHIFSLHEILCWGKHPHAELKRNTHRSGCLCVTLRPLQSREFAAPHSPNSSSHNSQLPDSAPVFSLKPWPLSHLFVPWNDQGILTLSAVTAAQLV